MSQRYRTYRKIRLRSSPEKNRSYLQEKIGFPAGFPTWSLFLLVLAATFVCCNKEREVRKYSEYSESETAAPGRLENIKPAVTAARQDTRDGRHFSWETPAGWKQIEDTTGMRLAAFAIEPGERKALCTIISLAGTAGGIKANVLRWAEQIDVKMTPDSKELEEFLAKKQDFRTRDDLPAVSLDFTSLTPGAGDKSILVSIISLAEATIFIKLTGTKSQLLENKEKFAALSRSFSLKPAE